MALHLLYLTIMQQPSTHYFSRFKGILLAIFALILLNLTQVFLILYNAKRLESDALSINLAGRQRMLSQNLTKNLLQIQLAVANDKPLPALLESLRTNYNLFNTTLTAFEIGDIVTDAAGNKKYLPATKLSSTTAPVEKGIQLWNPLKQSIQSVLHSPLPFPDNRLNEAVDLAVNTNIELLKNMNLLTVGLEEDSKKIASQWRWTQLAVVFSLIVLLLFLIHNFFYNIRKSDEIIINKNKILEDSLLEQQKIKNQLQQNLVESAVILSTVNQGLLLIDSKYTISNQHSLELEKMFRQNEFQGFSFLNILKRVLTDKDFHVARDFLEMMFDPTKKEKMLLKINPLTESEIHFQEKNATFTTKYFQFNFKRIYNETKITQIFISITDISNQVVLEKQLKESNEHKQKQFELLKDIIHIKPSQMELFLNRIDFECLEINKSLKAEDFIGTSMGDVQSGILRTLLQTIYTKIHTLKGHATTLRINRFIEIFHHFEEVIYKNKNRPKLSGEDFLGIARSLSELKKTQTECRQMLSLLVQHQQIEVPENMEFRRLLPQFDDAFSLLENLVFELSEKTNKKAKLVFKTTYQYTTRPIPTDILFDIITQLIRNSFAHGIETQEERVAKGKQPIAQIYVHLTLDELNRRSITYVDDGDGINKEKLYHKIVEQNLATYEQLENFTETEILNKLFQSGLSTVDEVSHYSGRGLGLTIVKQIIDKLDGLIFIHNNAGNSLQFSLTLP